MAVESVEVAVRGLSIRLPADPALLPDARDPGTLLLAETLEVEPAEAVLVVGGGSGLLAVVAARLAARGRVVVACRQVTSAEQAEAAAELNGVGLRGVGSEGAGIEVVRAADLRPLRGRAFDVALISVALAPSSAALYREIEQAALLLRPGGRCYLTGGKRTGVASAADRLAATLGSAEPIAYGKGNRVLLALRGEAVQATWAASDEPERVVEVELRGRRWRVGVREGVFAGGELDAGTRLLVEALRVGSPDAVLDLGCGGGLVGLAAAALASRGRVYLVDSDLAAVELAQANLARNGVANAVALPSSAYSAVRDVAFDVIASNPPFHVGRHQTDAVARRFIGEAPQHLRKGGRLYVVASRFLKYEPLVEAAFGSVATAAETRAFKVLVGVRAAARPAAARSERPASRARPGGSHAR